MWLCRWEFDGKVVKKSGDMKYNWFIMVVNLHDKSEYAGENNETKAYRINQ